MRLDKFLSDMKCATRSQLKKDIKAGLVSVNGEVIRQNDFAIDEKADKVTYKGVLYEYEKFVYYMLNKPAGVVSATEDKRERTVVDLLKEVGRNDLFPMGRLDKDTEGLLVLTNDGAMAHELLSPSKHVEKVYECTLADCLDEVQKEKLEQGVDIGEKKWTMPATVSVLAEKKIALTIEEGKFHQVKRMLHAVGNEVVYLKRVRMGGLLLDEQLEPGQYRKLTEEEVLRLQGK